MTVDGRYKVWTIALHDPCEFDRNIYKHLIEISEDINFCNVNLKERIGSESVAGLVYKIKIDGYPLALKVMPRRNLAEVKQNLNEMRIARLVSNMVVNNECAYFPYYIKGGLCEEFIMPNNEIIKSNVMVSELGIMDLEVYIMNEYNMKDEQVLNKYIKEVIMGIYCLNNKNIQHFDLHLRNILLVRRDECIIATLHDFGMSGKLKTYIGDYSKFMSHLIDILDRIYKIDTEFYLKIKMMNKNYFKDFEHVEDKSKYMLYILDKYF